MFFGKSRQQANEITTIILSLFRISFVGNRQVYAEGKFRPPYGFWIDPYILGFFNILIAMFIKHEFDGDSMSLNSKTKIMMRVYQAICGGEAQQVMMMSDHFRLNKDPVFLQGADDAMRVYGAVSGRFINDKDPLIDEAKRLAPLITQNDLNDIPGSSDYKSLGMAVVCLTLTNHIKQKYLSKNE